MNYGILLINSRYGVDITQKTRERRVCRPRQLYIYCISRSTTKGYREIAESVGLISHATVIHAINSIKGQCEHDRYLRAEIEELMKDFDSYYLTSKQSIITNSQYEMAALWLKSKKIDIDTQHKDWLNQKIQGDIESLIDLMIMFKNEKA